MNLEPLYDRVIIKRVENETKTSSGIIIPDNAQEKPMEGEVIAVGAGMRSDDGKIHPLIVKKGDRVLFAKWGGTEVKINNMEYQVMKESDILAIVKTS